MSLDALLSSATNAIPPLGDIAAPLIFIVLLITGWIIFSFLVSYMSGWRQLAKAYRANQPFSGNRFRPWAASMRWGVNYNGLITLCANPHGLFISTSFLFRAGHPPLFVPWADISTSTERTWWIKLMKLTFARYDSTFLVVPYKVGEKLYRESGNQLSGLT